MKTFWSIRSVLLLPALLVAVVAAVAAFFSIFHLKSQFDRAHELQNTYITIAGETQRLSEQSLAVHGEVRQAMKGALGGELDELKLYRIHSGLVDSLDSLQKRVVGLTATPELARADIIDLAGYVEEFDRYRRFIILATDIIAIDTTVAEEYITRAHDHFSNFAYQSVLINAALVEHVKKIQERDIKTLEQMFLYTGIYGIVGIILAIILAHVASGRINRWLTTVTDSLQKLGATDDSPPDLSDLAALQREARGEIKAIADSLGHFRQTLIDRREQEKHLQLAASVFTNAREGILISDREGRIIEVNDAFLNVTGYDRDELVGNRPSMLKTDRQDPGFYADMWDSLRTRGYWAGDIWNRRKNGDVYPDLLTITAIRDTDGRIERYIGLYTDITAQKALEQQLRHLAHYDDLTGLPNRNLLVTTVQQSMACINDGGTIMALAHLDLDDFKEVNDRLGHDTGNRILKAIAATLRETIREGDFVARLSGDDFIVVLNDLTGQEGAIPLLRSLLDAAAESVVTDGHDVQLSASLGVTFFPQEGVTTAEQLLRQANQAMYQAKLVGKGRYCIFDPEDDRTTRGHNEKLERIRQAIVEDELVLYYQPKVDMEAGTLIGAEALVRWRHPERGLLPPGAFLGDIAGHELEISLGEWVIEAALRQAGEWHAANLNISVSINIEAGHLLQKNFVDRLREALARHPELPPAAIDLEVVESAAISSINRSIEVIGRCKELGVTFSLDDFGTGYSTLTYLRHLPFDLIKIDQSFVRHMLEDEEDLAIVESVIRLASVFNRTVIAEGVETGAHIERLLELGCKLMQGYGIARPMLARELPEWYAKWRPTAPAGGG